MDHHSGPARLHIGKKRTIEPDRRHQVQVDFLDPLLVVERRVAAGRRRRPAQHMDDDIDPAEPLADRRSDTRAAFRLRKVGGHKLRFGHFGRLAPRACQHPRAKLFEQCHRRPSCPPGAGGDERALALQSQERGHGTISSSAILSPRRTKK